MLREAIICQNGWIFTHCVNGPWPPPLGFTRSCCDFFDMNVKKCVNVRLDKIWRNSAKICGQNVKFTLKLWQFYPWKYFFVPILCCQKASRIIQIRNINFYTWVRPPPLYTMCKKTSDLVADGFPKGSTSSVGPTILILLHSGVIFPVRVHRALQQRPCFGGGSHLIL